MGLESVNMTGTYAGVSLRVGESRASCELVMKNDHILSYV